MTLCVPRPVPIMAMETTASTRATLWRIDDFSRTSSESWRTAKDEETFINADDRRRGALHLSGLRSVSCEFTFRSLLRQLAVR